jgi:LacI family transcriptional regulator
LRSSRARSRRGSGRVTIKDVAAHADASLKTVSRVLNNEPNVRSATRQRIEETIAALGYRPSTSARSLAGRHAYVVGLTYGNPRPGYLVDVLSGVLDHCREAGYELFLYPFRHDDPDVVANIAKVMRHADVGGLILSPPLCDNGEVIRLLDEIDLPFARISASGHADHPSPYVTLDDRAAARDMTDHLLSLGHRRVGFIGGPENHPSAHLRLNGYKDALVARGVAFDGTLAVPGAFTLETGRDGAAALLALGEKRPTAIFASNDEMAAGAMVAVKEAGLSVPGDVSVAGFDDTDAAQFVWPPLTTVHQPIYEMAHAATGLLLERLQGRTAGRPPKAFSHSLAIRKSTAPPAG